MALAPILLFTYKRPDLTKLTLEALQLNDLAEQSDLYIFSDGPRNDEDHAKVDAVREVLLSVTGFRSVQIFSADRNRGLAESIILGVTEVIGQHHRAIVLEDDLVTSRNFLSFMNQALDRYVGNPQIFSIGGYTSPIKGLSGDGAYFTRRGTSWGWATWADRWNEIDWQVKDYAAFSQDAASRRRFNQMGSDMARMLDRQMARKINSWAIRWCYHQFKNDQLSVYPALSKVANIGFSSGASHTKGRFQGAATTLDGSGNTIFNFPERVEMDKRIISQFTSRFSITNRIRNKILNSMALFKAI